MTHEDLERAIEFLLKNQAAFDARQAAFDARQAASDARQAASDERFEAAREQTNQQISELAASQQGTQRQLDHLTNVVASIAETTRRNSEDIDALVKLVGGLVEGRNGKSGS
ncbi:MAG TPA: hypothetical protein VF703_14560 [Pyrinomonadaceae bacterium]|jgi:ABC-type transporter Mla subunit MlaD